MPALIMRNRVRSPIVPDSFERGSAIASIAGLPASVAPGGLEDRPLMVKYLGLYDVGIVPLSCTALLSAGSISFNTQNFDTGRLGC